MYWTVVGPLVVRAPRSCVYASWYRSTVNFFTRHVFIRFLTRQPNSPKIHCSKMNCITALLAAACLYGTAYAATGDPEETVEEDVPIVEFPDRSTIPVLSPEAIEVRCAP